MPSEEAKNLFKPPNWDKKPKFRQKLELRKVQDKQ